MIYKTETFFLSDRRLFPIVIFSKGYISLVEALLHHCNFLIFSQLVIDIVEKLLSLRALSLFTSVQEPCDKLLVFEGGLIFFGRLSQRDLLLLKDFFDPILDLSNLVDEAEFLWVLVTVIFLNFH